METAPPIRIQVASLASRNKRNGALLRANALLQRAARLCRPVLGALLSSEIPRSPHTNTRPRTLVNGPTWARKPLELGKLVANSGTSAIMATAMNAHLDATEIARSKRVRIALASVPPATIAPPDLSLIQKTNVGAPKGSAPQVQERQSLCHLGITPSRTGTSCAASGSCPVSPGRTAKRALRVHVRRVCSDLPVPSRALSAVASASPAIFAQRDR